MIRIDGEKVYIRETEDADLKYFADWEVKPEVTEFFTISEGRTIDDVRGEVEGRRENPEEIDFTICFKETDEVLGRIYISNINTHYDSMDITRIYVGDKTKRGLGLGEDALKCALKFGFDNLKLERITLDYFTGNEIASNLYRKVGFKDEGTMRHGGKKNGRYVDLNLMSILRDEYF